MNSKKVANENCILIQNFDPQKSHDMYSIYENEFKEYDTLSLVNFCVDNYDKTKLTIFLEKYNCHDLFEAIDSNFVRILQFKKILDTNENKIRIKKITIDHYTKSLNNLFNNTTLKGGKPFQMFIRRLFYDRRGINFMIKLILAFGFISWAIQVGDPDGLYPFLGNLLAAAVFTPIIYNMNYHTIPENVFQIIYNMVINTSIPINITFNEYAQMHADGIHILRWIPAFGSQIVIWGDQRNRLRFLYNVLNRYSRLVQDRGWLDLGNDPSVNLDLALATLAHQYDLRNPNQQEGQVQHNGRNDHLIIRRASEISADPPTENICSICFEDLLQTNIENETKNENGYLVKLHQDEQGPPHIYHFKCIKQWLSQNRSCPVCRQIIHSALVIANTSIPAERDGLDFFDVPPDQINNE